MANHAPGPWGCIYTSNHAHDYRLTKPNGDVLPVHAPGNDHSEQRATACVLGASFDMLVALKALLEWGREHTSPRDENSPHDLLVAAAAAVAKAEGSANG